MFRVGKLFMTVDISLGRCELGSPLARVEVFTEVGFEAGGYGAISGPCLLVG